jgi:hypothetical protein
MITVNAVWRAAMVKPPGKLSADGAEGLIVAFKLELVPDLIFHSDLHHRKHLLANDYGTGCVPTSIAILP